MSTKNVLITMGAVLFVYYIFFYDSSQGFINNNKNPNSPNANANAPWAQGDYGQEQLIKLDVEALQKAFINAKSPQEFEKEANRLYSGDEVISIFVKNPSEASQNVTLYIDQTQNGFSDDDTKLITLTRNVNNQQVEYSRSGYGPYSYYNTTSPLTYALTGALITYWAMRTPFYSTPVSNYSNLRNDRNSFRNTPAGKTQNQKTKQASSNFNKNASSKQKASARSWASKSKRKGSWASNNNSRAKKQTTNRSNRATNRSSRRSIWGGRSSRRSSGFRGFRGFRRR